MAKYSCHNNISLKIVKNAFAKLFLHTVKAKSVINMFEQSLYRYILADNSVQQPQTVVNNSPSSAHVNQRKLITLKCP